MADVMSIPAAEANALVAAALEASNTAPDNAASVANALIGAELCGQGGHGLRRVCAYAAQARSGKVDGHAVPSPERVRPGAVWIDAGHGFAYPALDLAVSELGELAPSQGIAVAAIRRSHHSGVMGLPVERLADAGLIGLMMTNSPVAMAPWGSNTPLFGTNPIAFSCPRGEGPPIVVDVSLSKVARGKIMAANQKGEAIPDDWAFDKDGNPTTDPKAALAGTMAPLGGAKGTALALMVELLTAGLTGANFAFEQSSFFDGEGNPPGTGHTLIAIDPAAFGTGTVDRFSRLAQLVEGADGARLPGARRQQIRERILSEGIPTDASLIEEINGLIANPAGQKTGSVAEQRGPIRPHRRA